MTALRFSEADTLRCRFAISPLWETVAAVRLLWGHHRRPVYEPWTRGRAGLAADLHLEGLRAVQPHIGHTPDFLAPPPSRPTTTFAGELIRVRQTPVEQVVTELTRSRDAPTNPYAADIDAMLADPAAARDQLADAIERAWTALIEPDWPVIRRLLDDDVAYRGEQLTTGGLAALFDDLHPALSWEGNELVASRIRDHDRNLAGAGLLLVPSVFGWPYLALLVDPAYQPTIVYPARGTARLWTERPLPPDRLARLLGRTRATMLAALDPAATTSDLAREHGIALATVAQHLAALHDAGLASRRRTGHRVHYRRTDLGQALIDAAVE